MKRLTEVITTKRYAAEKVNTLIQKELEDRSLEILSSGFDRIPQATNQLLNEPQKEVLKLIETIEGDDDVQNVYTNAKL